MANGEHIEVAKAYVTIVPSLEGSQKSISEELGVITSDAAKSTGEAAGQDFGNALATGLKATAAVVTAAMAAVTAAAIGAGKAFIDSANDVAEWGNTVDKESQKMNMSAAGYQEWDFILEHAGASIEGMKTSMKKLTVAAEEGNDAFAALGISQEQLATMSPEETWNATIAALQGVADEGERTALANQLLGKGAVELAPLFNMTAEETAALKDQVYELGGIMSDDAVKAAAEYEDELQNMQVALTGVKNNMMSKFLPGMSSVMKGLSQVFSGQGGIEEIKSGLEDIVGNIAELTPQFLEIASAIVTSVLDGFAPMLPTVVESIFSFITQALVTITNLIPQLLPVITTGIQGIITAVFNCLPLIMSSLLTLVTDLATWLASGDNVKVLTNGIVQLVTMLVKQIGAVLPVLLPAIVSIISDVATTITTPENIALILEAVLFVVGAVVMALANSVPEFIDYIVGLTTNIKNNILAFGNWVKPYVSQAISAIYGTVQSWGNNIKNFISSAVNSITSTVSWWLSSLGNTFINGFNGVLYTVNVWTVNLYNSFVNMVNNVLGLINWWIGNLSNGFINGFNNIQYWISNILGSIGGLVSGALNTLASLPGKIWDIGSDMAEGLINGLDVDWVIDQVKKLGKKAIKALKEELGIASPSKAFAEIGYYSALGFGGGWSDEMDKVEADMVDSMDNLTSSMTAEVNAYGAGEAATVGETNNYHGGDITMNIYGAEGQDVNALAEVIAERLGEMTRRKEVVYG